MPIGVGCPGMPVETGPDMMGVPSSYTVTCWLPIETTMISGPAGGFGGSCLAWPLEGAAPVPVLAPESLLLLRRCP